MRTGRPPAAPAAPPPLLALPDELLEHIAGWLSAGELAVLLATHARWRHVVWRAAQRKVAALDPRTKTSRCWPLTLASVEALVDSIGLRPEHNWIAEFPALMQLRWEEEGVRGEIETLLVKSAMAAELRHGLQWPLEDAQAVALLCTFFRGAFAKMLQSSACCKAGLAPANQWLLRDALLAAAHRQQNPAPLCYALLNGSKSSLCANDPSWIALEGIHNACLASQKLQTYAAAIATENVITSKCAGSTWVCFESLPDYRGGHRSLIDFGR